MSQSERLREKDFHMRYTPQVKFLRMPAIDFDEILVWGTIGEGVNLVFNLSK